ncbi:hypothetical protein MCOR28_002085 [Pyricularia oryzae]|nr:hypothetical protein MCOR28_002085 [Pyricularia oryzae]
MRLQLISVIALGLCAWQSAAKDPDPYWCSVLIDCPTFTLKNLVEVDSGFSKRISGKEYFFRFHEGCDVSVDGGIWPTDCEVSAKKAKPDWAKLYVEVFKARGRSSCFGRSSTSDRLE